MSFFSAIIIWSEADFSLDLTVARGFCGRLFCLLWIKQVFLCDSRISNSMKKKQSKKILREVISSSIDKLFLCTCAFGLAVGKRLSDGNRNVFWRKKKGKRNVFLNECLRYQPEYLLVLMFEEVE